LRFLVDANLSPRVVARLRLEGHDVVHVGEVGLLTADDETILAHASRDERAIVSADALILANLEAVETDLRAGAVVTIGRGHHRVRTLPMRRRD
jgi:uncharacterized protein with PIN domain